MNMQYFSCHKYSCWMHDASCFPVKSTLSVSECALKASCFDIILNGPGSASIQYLWCHKLCLWAPPLWFTEYWENCEVTVSDSAGISFYTEGLKHSTGGSRGQTLCGLHEDLKWLQLPSVSVGHWSHLEEGLSHSADALRLIIWLAYWSDSVRRRAAVNSLPDPDPKGHSVGVTITWRTRDARQMT